MDRGQTDIHRWMDTDSLGSRQAVPIGYHHLCDGPIGVAEWGCGFESHSPQSSLPWRGPHPSHRVLPSHEGPLRGEPKGVYTLPPGVWYILGPHRAQMPGGHPYDI